MKRLFTFVLAVLTAAGVLTSCGEVVFIDWKIDDGILTVDGISDIEFTEYPWSSKRDEITEIVILDGITGIGDRAFAGCENLKTVHISSTVKSIGSKAFADCDSLEKVYLPVIKDGELTIAASSTDDSSVFVWVDESGDNTADTEPATDTQAAETEVAETVENKPPRVTVVPEPAEFSTKWSYGNSVLTIAGKGSMDEYHNIEGTYIYDTPWKTRNMTVKEVVFGNYVTHVTKGAFFRDLNLEKVNIPGNIVYIGFEGFGDCLYLKDLTFNEGLLWIDDYAFCGCAMESVIIPSTVFHIGSYAFDGCMDLKHVIIESKEGDVEIGEFAFPEHCRITYTG